MSRKRVFALVVLLLILFALGTVLYVLPSGVLKQTSLPSLPRQKQEASVTLQKQYQNPFDKNTQYVNPFSGYKNPFDTLKK